LVVGLLVANGALAGAATAQTIPVRIGGEASSFVGVQLRVPVEVDMSLRTEKLGGIALTIRWNPSVLQLVDGQNGDLGELVTNEDSAPAGVLKLAGVSPAGVGGRIVLGVGRFVPLVPDTTTFRLEVTEFYAAGTFADLLPDVVASSQLYCNAAGLYGDLNGDQSILGNDAALVLLHAVGRSIAGMGNAALGDVDADGLTDPRDALLILSAAVGLDVSAFRVGRAAPGGACVSSLQHSFTVSPATLTLDLNQQAQMLAVAYDSTGLGVAATGLVWSSSDTAVARVDSIGLVTARAAGVATIRAESPGAEGGAAVVTVARRRVHWVDALARAEDEDRLGAPERPFATIQEAVDYASPGDTVRIRSGRYPESVQITRAVVIEGDSAGGAPKPVLARSTAQTAQGFDISAPGLVALRYLKLDPLWSAVVATGDTFVVRDVELRMECSGGIGISAGPLAVFRMERSVLTGAGTAYQGINCYSSEGIFVTETGLVAIDSSVIADVGGSGAYLNAVDSLLVRGSQIRDNYGYGVYHYCYACSRDLAMVVTGNRFTQNASGHLYSYDYYTGGGRLRSARLDHNVWVGGGYEGVTLYGDTLSTVVSVVADTFRVRQGGWLALYQFDSLLVDSVSVFLEDYSYYNYAQGGRVAVVRNSRFLGLDGGATALEVDPTPRDSMRVVLRNLEFRGPDSASCDRCGYGLGVSASNETGGVSVDAADITGFNLYGLLDVSDARLALRDAVIERVRYGLSLNCTNGRVTNVSFTDVEQGINASGCDLGDSLVVDSTTFSSIEDAIETYNLSVVVTNTSIADLENYALYHQCGPAQWVRNTVANSPGRGEGDGVYAYGYYCGTADTLWVRHSTFSGQENGALNAYYHPVVVDSSSFADSDDNVYAYSSAALVRDNLFLRPLDNQAIHLDGDTVPVSALRNTVTCESALYNANEAIWVDVTSPDTALVADNVITGCYGGGIYAYAGGGGIAGVLRNSVSLPDTAPYGIRLSGAATGLTRVAGNTVTGKARNGSIRAEGNVSRLEVDSNVVSGPIVAGILITGDVDSLRIRDNTVTDLRSASCCYYFANSAGIKLEGNAADNVEARVLGNRVLNSGASGILISRGYTASDTVTVLVDSNVVRGADSIGIWVRYDSRADVRKNAVDSSGLDGVRLEQYVGVAPALVNFNNLTRNAVRGVNNAGSAGVIDATNNWWGDPNGPLCAGGASGCVGTVGDSVSANVNFAPYLAAPTDAPPPTAPVFVAAESWAARLWTAQMTRVQVPAVGRMRAVPRAASRPAAPPAPAAPPPRLGRAPAPEGYTDPLAALVQQSTQAEDAARMAIRQRATERATARAALHAAREARRAEAVRRRESRRDGAP
jgi:hypothetical protein